MIKGVQFNDECKTNILNFIKKLLDKIPSTAEENKEMFCTIFFRINRNAARRLNYFQ